MEHYLISKLLQDSTFGNSESRNSDKQSIEVNYLSNTQYSFNKNISLKTLTLRSDLCRFSDAYFVVNGK